MHVGVLWRSADEARSCGVGRIELALCLGCGLLTNVAFDSSLLDYSLEYDNSLHSSAVFREFEEALITDLVDRHQLDHGHVVEVGCGKGHFLESICAHASATGDGFDPSLEAERVLADDRVRLHPRYFDVASAPDEFDLLVCRQVLEHIAEPRPFLETLRAALQVDPRRSMYIDVPNSTMLLGDLSVWDLIYEHCHYFLAESLASLVKAVGFEVTRAWPSFNAQFLSIEVRPAETPVVEHHVPTETLQMVEGFAGSLEERRRSWVDRLRAESAAGRRVVVWGAGARAVTFVALAQATLDNVAYLVDVNPAKQGTFLAGTGHSIHPPEVLVEQPPDVVVLVNGIYESEIRGALKEMALEPTLVVA